MDLPSENKGFIHSLLNDGENGRIKHCAGVQYKDIRDTHTHTHTQSHSMCVCILFSLNRTELLAESFLPGLFVCSEL